MFFRILVLMSRSFSPKLPRLKLLWITDPWTTLDHLQDTTLRLALEGLNLGIPSYWSASDFLLSGGDSRLAAVSLTTDFIQTFKPESVDQRQFFSPSEFHHLHYRIDPPVDFNYISLIEELLKKGAKETQIMNPPALIARQSEKVPPDSLLHLAPLHRVVRSHQEAKDAFPVLRSHAEFVSKPLNLAQSRGVKKWSTPKTEAEFVKILETETQGFGEPIFVEEYLPGVMDGEVRMWFANGEFIAALKKHPKSGDFRVLIDEGSKVEPYFLNADEEKAAKDVGQTLKAQGAAFAAIDFISGKISDYNITSPGLLRQLEAVHGNKNFARVILEKLYG